MNQQTFEANHNFHVAGFYPQIVAPGVTETAPGHPYRILFDNNYPVAVVAFEQWAIVHSGTSEEARKYALSLGKIIFTVEWEIVQKLAQWLTEWHALLIAIEENQISPWPSREFQNTAHELRTLLESLYTAEIYLAVGNQ